MSETLAPSVVQGATPTPPPGPPGRPGRPGRPRKRPAPRPLPAPAGQRGKGSRASGALDDKPHFVPVAHALRAWRLRAGLTQKQLAELTEEVVADDARRAYRERRPPTWKHGLSQYGINRFENAVHSPLPHNVVLLAAALNRSFQRQGRPERVATGDLQAGTTDALVAFLVAEQEKFEGGEPAFWAHLGIGTERARRLQAGAPWTAEELGAVALAYPNTADQVRDALIDQTRRQKGLPGLRQYAVRDRAHPDYADYADYVASHPRRPDGETLPQ